MPPCTSLRNASSLLGRATQRRPPCRHASTNRPSRAETQAALAAQVDRALQADEHGATLKLHPHSKTIETVVGALPLSPVMDPAWIEARRRFRTPKPKTPAHTYLGRFRKKLYLNPYAQALATPWRLCTATETGLPRYFLQDFEVVTNPETGQPCFVPGDRTDAAAPDTPPPPVSGQESSPEGRSPTDAPRPLAGPSAPVGYVLARHDVLELLGSPRRVSSLGGKHIAMLARRAHLSRSGLLPRLVWPPHMHRLVLDLLRARAVDALLRLARLDAAPARGYLRPCASWAQINRDMPHRGCVLWSPGEAAVSAAAAETPGPWATLDIEGAKYEGKMPVHDLRRLLGDEHLARLRAEPAFADSTLLVLGKRRTIPAQLLLWKLQGYLAEYPGRDEAEAD
ncbi:hypothetical protein D7B24_006951 [Verticillium nonalfalfae]|uniref:Uncharacterized protein n=1 Tax=Verticillium nonalfalfae TaxID=1051616 RepID=A0A3M9Y9B7_9PEZI|nr:uncharacterized protein D7B24_006951 [Verticillium nonalfalfae]RNJ56705.1 hypothetical protein D7B24_006951 [Verticillium nonalfalfae]